jgi:hypothetical protein
MEGRQTYGEFDGEIDHEGKITVPASVRRKVKKGPVRIRLSDMRMEAGLSERGVTEDEIHIITSTQLESREQVVKFLLTEGALKSRTAFRRRSGRRGRR